MVRTMLWAVALTATAAGAAHALSGHDQFVSTCSACHRETGLGVPGAFPALAKDPFVTGASTAVVATVLNGRGGMPSFKGDLTDAQVAAVISYVRASWGNAAAPVTAAEVAAVRAKAAPASARPLQVH